MVADEMSSQYLVRPSSRVCSVMACSCATTAGSGLAPVCVSARSGDSSASFEVSSLFFLLDFHLRGSNGGHKYSKRPERIETPAGKDKGVCEFCGFSLCVHVKIIICVDATNQRAQMLLCMILM